MNKQQRCLERIGITGANRIYLDVVSPKRRFLKEEPSYYLRYNEERKNIANGFEGFEDLESVVCHSQLTRASIRIAGENLRCDGLQAEWISIPVDFPEDWLGLSKEQEHELFYGNGIVELGAA